VRRLHGHVSGELRESGDAITRLEGRRASCLDYRIARRSATECAAILDLVGELRLADADQLRHGEQQLQTVVAMPIGLAKHMERQAFA
jgi:hypothetical protein